MTLGAVHRAGGLVLAASLLAFSVGAIAHPMPGTAMPGMADMPGHHHHDDAPSNHEKLGRVDFPTSCGAQAEVGITRGVALLHSFGYAKAQMQFEAVAKADPDCAMAHWGVAMTQYQELWDAPDAAALKRGAEEMQAARTIAARHPQTTARENAYIDAMSAFFDPAAGNARQRADAYEAKMDALHAAYPNDVEGAAFDALAIIASVHPGDTSLSHEHRALAILLPLFKAHPDHPGLAHYIIHTCDTPALAEEGLPAARLYAKIAPASAHALHMPGHIFARRGLWKEDIDANLASVKASNMAEAAHEPGAAHQLHADEFLIYAYLQTGQTDKARALTGQIGAVGDHMLAMPGMDDMKDMGHYADNELRMLFALETHDWNTAATLKPAAGSKAYEGMDLAWGKAIAAGHLKDASGAAEALAEYDRGLEAAKTSPMADYLGGPPIRRDAILGWKAYAEGKDAEAEAKLRESADLQDKLGQGEVDIPSREMLADLLMLQHKPKEALAEYKVALTLSPHRLNGLKAAAEAAREAGQPKMARAFERDATAQLGIGKALGRPA